MKKIFTSFLTLLLLMVASNAMAEYKATESVEPQVGESYLLGSADGTNYFVTYKGALQTAAADDSYLWQIEATGETTDAGLPTYYLKSAETGKYFQEYDQSKLLSGLDGYDIFGYAGFNGEMGDKATAMPVTIEYSEGSCTITRVKTVDGTACKLKHQGTDVGFDPWGDDGTQLWSFYQYEGKTVQEQLAELVEKLSYESYPAGTEAGYYPADLVAAYKAALKEAYDKAEDPDFNDFQTLYDNLVAAYEAVKASMIRVSDGYYRIVNGLSAFVAQQGEDAVKTMYDKDGLGYWKNLDKDEATMIWKISQDPSDKTLYNVVNAYTGRHYTSVTTSGAVTLTADEDGVQTYIEIAGYEDNVPKFNIRPTTASASNGQYIHAGGHSSGAGVSGQLVGWYSTLSDGTAGASEWEFRAVTAEEAEAVIAAQAAKDDKGAILTNMRDLIAEAEHRYYATGTYTQGEGLITSVDQLSSNATEPTEGSLDALIDGDASTYWHSTWSSGSVPGDSHYLQVDLINPVDQPVELYVKRRAASDDHVTLTTLYGSNDGETWNYVTKLTLENATSGAEYTTVPFETCGYRYLRFWTTDTYYSGGSTRGYCHYAEFQLYPVTMDSDCQLAKIENEEVAKNLKTAIATARGIADPSKEDVDALQAAYDAFCAISADPTDLNTAIANAESELAAWTIGTEPGYLSQESADALQAAIDAAKAVLEKESYTQAELDAQTSTLNELVENNSAIKPDPEKWYTIAWVYSDVTYYLSSLNDSETATTNEYWKFYTEENITNPQIAQWRFIPAGKGYLLQNRATGLTVCTYGTANYAKSCFQAPSSFRFAYTGDGRQALYATAFGGTVHGYMIASGSSVEDLTFASYGTSGYTLLYLTEVKTEDESTLTANSKLTTNAFSVLISPVSITNISENAIAYNLVGINKTDESLSILLNETTTAEAGTPVIIFTGSEDGEVVADNQTDVQYTFGGTYAAEPVTTETGLVGTYATTGTAERGDVIIKSGRFAIAEEETSINTWSGYCKVVATTATEADNTIEVEIPTSINDALASIAKSGNIYNAAGQLVGNGNIRDLKKMGRGMYIINGVKVMVK